MGPKEFYVCKNRLLVIYPISTHLRFLKRLHDKRVKIIYF